MIAIYSIANLCRNVTNSIDRRAEFEILLAFLNVKRFGMEEHMMPLTLAEAGEENIIRKIGGKQEVKAHLENLGFVVGGTVTVVNAIGGNVIVNVKDSRVAVSKEMAQKIMV